MDKNRVAVVIPSYRVSRTILSVLTDVGPEVDRIYVVDDNCPEGSGQLVEAKTDDPRVTVIYGSENQGVGGAVLAGYRAAIADGNEIIVKVDGDGQMDPRLIPALVAPIVQGEADYTKGNRFFNVEDVKVMPWVRLIGNAGLSFLTKLSSGYWNVFDPTNGFTAIHAGVAAMLPAEKIAKRFFFESDMLFRLSTLRAVVVDVPMAAVYGDESSNLRVLQALFSFPLRHANNLAKRVVYNYFLRDFSVASIELLLGAGAVVFGVVFGAHSWISASRQLVEATAGTVMLSAMPVIIGMQMLLGFISYDINTVPKVPLQRRFLRDAVKLLLRR